MPFSTNFVEVIPSLAAILFHRWDPSCYGMLKLSPDLYDRVKDGNTVLVFIHLPTTRFVCFGKRNGNSTRRQEPTSFSLLNSKLPSSKRSHLKSLRKQKLKLSRGFVNLAPLAFPAVGDLGGVPSNLELTS